MIMKDTKKNVRLQIRSTGSTRTKIKNNKGTIENKNFTLYYSGEQRQRKKISARPAQNL